MAGSATSPSPLRVRDFRLLWLGEAISSLGDQFALIALPWLALLLTGSALALGSVLALMAVPRAVLMFVGGAYVDRLSPRRVMLVSNAVRLLAVTALGAIVLVGAAELWMLYAFALVFGIADAFFFPAQTAMVPELVGGDQLQKANGIVQGTGQLTVLVGPALAGLAIAVLSSGATGSVGVAGVGAALLIDGLTFVASLVTLLLIANRPTHQASQGSVVQQIGEGVRFVLGQPVLRVAMLLSMGANLLIVGPFEVGFPVLAFTRLPEGAAAFGLILSAFGGGSLLGMAGAMAWQPPARRFGVQMLLLISLSGLATAAVAFTNSTILALVLTGLDGLVLGYTNLSFMTWIQRRIPRQLMGRVMSLLMFSSMALTPISMAVAGVVVTVSLEGLFLVGGLGMFGLTLAALASPSIRRMGLEPTIEDDPEAELEPDSPQVARAA